MCVFHWVLVSVVLKWCDWVYWCELGLLVRVPRVTFPWPMRCATCKMDQGTISIWSRLNKKIKRWRPGPYRYGPRTRLTIPCNSKEAVRNLCVGISLWFRDDPWASVSGNRMVSVRNTCFRKLYRFRVNPCKIYAYKYVLLLNCTWWWSLSFMTRCV